MSFVKFTLGNIRNSVKRKLDDPSFDDAIIDEAANDFQFELFNDNRIRFMEQNTAISVTAGASESVDLPNDYMTLIRATMLYSPTQPQNITDYEMDYDEFMEQYATYSVAPAGKPLEWTFFGEKMRFNRPSDATYSINIDYLRSPKIMTTATDTCELPINCRELMTLGTLERVMRVNEDYNEADAELGRLQGLRTAFVRNYGRGSGTLKPRVIKSGRAMVRRRTEW